MLKIMIKNSTWVIPFDLFYAFLSPLSHAHGRIELKSNMSSSFHRFQTKIIKKTIHGLTASHMPLNTFNI